MAFKLLPCCLPQETYRSFPSLSLYFIPTNATECALIRNPYPNLPSGRCPISLLPVYQLTSSEKKPTLHPLSASSVPLQPSESSLVPHHSRVTFFQEAPASLQSFQPMGLLPTPLLPQRCSDHLLEEALNPRPPWFFYQCIPSVLQLCLPQRHF